MWSPQSHYRFGDGKVPIVPVEQKTRCEPESIWALWKREYLSSGHENRTTILRLSSVQPSHITDWAVPALVYFKWWVKATCSDCPVILITFYDRTPEIIFHIPRNPYKWKQKWKWKWKMRRLAAHREYFRTANCRTNFLRYFEGHLEIFAVYQNLRLFIPRFLAELLSMFWGTLVGLHCSRLTGCTARLVL